MAAAIGVPISGGRFLVTGGTGFVGSFVVDRLVDAGAREVIALDAAPRPENVQAAADRGNVRVEQGDITDPTLLDRLCNGMDGVFHLAVLPLGPCIENPRSCLDVNIVGTFNVIEAAVRHGVRKVVFSSASSVYGDTLETTGESHPFGARTMYGASKVAGELFLRSFHDTHNIDYVALRYMNVYGPRQVGGLIMSVLRRIRSGEPPVIAGDGSQSFDFVHVADVADINVRAMESNLTDEALNVGSGGETSVREIVEMLLRLTGSDLVPQFQTDANVVMTRRVGSNERARDLLGWVPALGLEEGLRHVIAAEGAS